MQPTLVQVPPGAGLPSGVLQSSMHAACRPELRRADRGDIAAGAGADDYYVKCFGHL